jgi:hypothetical protein
VDETHKEIANEGSVLGAVEKGVFAVEDRSLQDLCAKVMPTAGLCRVEV